MRFHSRSVGDRSTAGLGRGQEGSQGRCVLDRSGYDTQRLGVAGGVAQTFFLIVPRGG